MLDYLKSIGLPVNPLSKKIMSASEMIAYHHTLESNRNHIDYEIDGSVIKVNNYKKESDWG